MFSIVFIETLLPFSLEVIFITAEVIFRKENIMLITFKLGKSILHICLKRTIRALEQIICMFSLVISKRFFIFSPVITNIAVEQIFRKKSIMFEAFVLQKMRLRMCLKITLGTLK